MVNNSPIDLVFWGNILAGGGLLLYATFLWLQIRGVIKPGPAVVKCVRIICLFLLLMPIAARYQYSQSVIFYLSTAIFVVGLFIRLRRKWGI